MDSRAASMRDSLQKSQAITDNMVTMLGSFDRRLSSLDTELRPLQLRTDSIRKAHENINKVLKALETILAQFDLSRQVEAKILKGPHEDLGSYIEAVDQLRNIILYFSDNKSFKSSVAVANHAKNLLGRAISKLEDGFQMLLSSYSKPVDPDSLYDCLPTSMRPSTVSPRDGDANIMKQSPDHLKKSLETVVYRLPVLIPPRILPLLHEIALQIIQEGRQQQFLNSYREARSLALEQTLSKLGAERLGKEDLQKMQSDVLEAKIRQWITFMRIAVKLLFPGEKKVCDEILKGNDTLRDQCFAEVTANSVAVLLSFVEAIAKSKRSPEKLFVLLDMYEIMQKLPSEMNTIFGSKYCGKMLEAVVVLTKRLAQASQETFANFEEAVEKDVTKPATLDGAVHPLTNYVIDYVMFLFEYRSTLKQLLEEIGVAGAEEQLTSKTKRIVQALQINLEGKSKQYKDPALTQIFLMNNIHCIVRSISRSEVKDIFGNDWVQIQRRVVQQHANQYKRISWSKILQYLSAQGLQSSGSGSYGDSGGTAGVSRTVVKDKFKTFNLLFEEIRYKHSQWIVPDSELRECLRLSVAEILLPAYRSFVKRSEPLIQGAKNPRKYMKYSPEDLEGMLAEFFERKPWSEPRR